MTLKDAGEILMKARSLNKDHLRTLENMIDLFKQEKKKKEALKLVNEVLKKNKENLKALYLLGNVCFEDKELKKAEDIFNKILSIEPREVEARVRLGRVLILKKKYDLALELYQPLVDTLVKKHKEDKAVGLLGLILMAKKDHLPSLESLAGIYREKKQKKSFEIVARRLMKEYTKKKMDQKIGPLREELSGVLPEKKKDKPKVIPLEAYSEKVEPEPLEEIPDDVRITQQIKERGAIASQVKEEEIVERLEKGKEKAAGVFERGEKLTSAEIFADTDIVPLVSQETGEKRYFDLSRQLEEELEAIKHIFYQQTRGDTTVVEKELSAIVSDFKMKVDEKIGTADLEARYNLGIAYFEQDLIDDAIKEFMLASQDEKWEMESFTNLGECYKHKNEFSEAIKWYEKALKLVGGNSIQAYALKYEIASLYEAKKESEKALMLFGEVLKWNPEYGDVTARIRSIEKQASK